MTIGEKILRERKRKGLTQQALADLCGITKRTVASYETDGRQPHYSTLQRLAAVLECSCDYLSDNDILDFQAPSSEQTYINGLREVYGDTAADEIQDLISRSVSLFAGGRLDQDAKDRYFLALTNAYIACKKESEKG